MPEHKYRVPGFASRGIKPRITRGPLRQSRLLSSRSEREALRTMHSSYHASFWIALLVGIASGSVGSFVLLRRMALVGDALSHVALPGIALALAYHLDPFWGVIATLLAAAIVVWWLESKSNLPTEALVGLLFTASLAIGILTI